LLLIFVVKENKIGFYYWLHPFQILPSDESGYRVNDYRTSTSKIRFKKHNSVRRVVTVTDESEIWIHITD